MIHTVDNQNVVFMKQHVEFCHPIYVLEVKAVIAITKSTQQRRLCFANYRSQLNLDKEKCGSWKRFFDSEFEKYGGEVTLTGNLNIKDSRNIIKVSDPFFERNS